MKWNKFIIIGLIAGIIGHITMGVNPIQANGRVSPIPGFILLGGIGFLGAGVLGKLTSKKK
jgi:hypothetical protein